MRRSEAIFDAMPYLMVSACILLVPFLLAHEEEQETKQEMEALVQEAQVLHKLHGDQCEKQALENAAHPLVSEEGRHRWFLVSQHCPPKSTP